MDRRAFAERQALMTASWYECVKSREGNVDAYVAKRYKAYISCWKEAGRFIPDGSKILDIGGGNLRWITLVEDAGFEIHTAQVGKEYPEHGFAYFIYARKVATCVSFRIDPNFFKKDHYHFIDFKHPSISYSGDERLSAEGNARHLRGENWSISFPVPLGSTVVLPILFNHDWSGKIEIYSSNCPIPFFDLFSWFPYVQPCAHVVDCQEVRDLLTVRPVGKNISSRAAEGVFLGFLYK